MSRVIPSIAAAAVVILVLVVVSIGFRVNTRPAPNSCLNNLRQLDGAKQLWALENEKTTNDVPALKELTAVLGRMPACPEGGYYTVGPVGEPPVCSVGGTHALPPMRD